MSNLEYITQARKLLTEDYKTKHTNEYNSWLANHQNAWMQPHIIVPFPPFIINSALAPFKPSVSAPSEEAVVAKALALYNQFNPAPVTEAAPVVEELSVEPIVEAELITEEPVVEPVVEAELVTEEPIVEEPVVPEPTLPADAIRKIFQTPVVEAVIPMPVAEPMPPTIEQALNVVPQPVEELAKVNNSGRVLPSVLQRLRDMAFNRSATEEKNV